MRNERKPWKSVRSLWLTRIGFLFVAFLLWALMELGQERFESRINVPVTLTQTPDDRLIVNPPEVVRVLSKAEGLYAFQERFREQTHIELPFDAFESDGVSRYYLTSERFGRLANSVIPSSVSWRLVGDTLWLETSTLQSKLVPVVANLKLEFETPFYAYGESSLSPDSIFIFGREEILDTLSGLYLQRFSEKNVNSPISYYAELEMPEGLTSPTDVIHVEQDVKQFTEKQLRVRLFSNHLEDHWRPSPNTIQVRCRVPLDAYQQLSDVDIRAEIQAVEGGNAVAPVVLTKVPQYVEVIDWSPQYVDLIQNQD